MITFKEFSDKIAAQRLDEAPYMMRLYSAFGWILPDMEMSEEYFTKLEKTDDPKKKPNKFFLGRLMNSNGTLNDMTVNNIPDGTIYMPNKADMDEAPSTLDHSKLKRELFGRSGGEYPDGWLRWLVTSYDGKLTLQTPNTMEPEQIEKYYSILVNLINSGKLPRFTNLGLVKNEVGIQVGAINKTLTIDDKIDIRVTIRKLGQKGQK